ncbi:MAG: Stp1/IreP family PP2C-type Ser/Thr phosphatase [Lachnospiraceae bacterium]|nr:Stp1/IreP family PP2C-type Ser/Thr phosphatase [Lachnospiraceae bacterium]
MKFYAITDIGRKRELNEDYIYTSGQPIGALPNLFIVADGMGGHKAGDYASTHTVDRFVEVIRELGEEHGVQDAINEAVTAANAYIYQRSRENSNLSGMGTTLVLASCIGNEAIVANIGDSRLYLVNDAMTQITRDHSLVEEMVTLGGIDREMARNHPDKNIITRAVGVKEEVAADFFEVDLTKGDKLLLCSDGLTNMLRDEEIHQIIQENKELEQAAKALIDAANENGGRDNIAVVLVEPFGGQE